MERKLFSGNEPDVQKPPSVASQKPDKGGAEQGRAEGEVFTETQAGDDSLGNSQQRADKKAENGSLPASHAAGHHQYPGVPGAHGLPPCVNVRQGSFYTFHVFQGKNVSVFQLYSVPVQDNVAGGLLLSVDDDG
ncbi:hypothetical protein, partial [Bacteroides caccae]|uniref:hypothetical protein n=1 Tax=Bacteroides caccae TaxID=47678 RepID=UPI001F00D870